MILFLHNEEFPSTSQFVGTPYFMAHEIFTTKRNDNYVLLNNLDSIKIDVYAFAVTIHFFLSRKPYLDGFHTTEDFFSFIGSGQRPPFEKGIFSKSMENFIKRCWDPDPEKRPDFDEIVNILKSGRVKLSDSDTDTINENEVKAFLDYCNESY